MSDAIAVARDQLRAFIERIERLEEEKKTIADDIKDVYGEAKGMGYDTKILRKVIAIRKQDRDERAEQEAILDSYLIALGMIEQPGFFDDEPVQSAPAARQPAMALRSDGGLSILTKHEDIRTAPVTAPEFHAKASGDNGATEQDIEDTADSVTGDASRSSRGDDSPATISNTDAAISRPGIATQGRPEIENRSDKEAPEAGASGGMHDESAFHPAAHSDQPGEGGADEVTSSAPGAGDETQTSNTGEGAANTALPTKPKVSFRPNCQHPENCASGTRDHCWSCRRAMQKSEEMA